MEEPVVKLGTDQVEKCINFALELVNVADKIGRESGNARWGHMFLLMDEATALTGITIDQVKAQLKDLDAVELADLKAKVKAKFDLGDDNLELNIEDALEVVFDLYKMYEKCAAIVARFKAA